MTLTELRYAVAVARERHFGRAAQSCFVSQPTLSVGIKKLEEDLGVLLFERASNEITLTAIGEQIVAQATRTLEAAEAIKVLAQQGGDPLSQPLRLGAIYTVGPYLLPLMLPLLRHIAPAMQLLVQENYTGHLRDQLKHGKLDAAILALPFEEPGMVIQPLYDEPFQVAMHSGHAWRHQAAIDPQALLQEPVLLLSNGNCFRDQVLQYCPGLGHSNHARGIQQTLEGSSLETIRYMVASGVGVTVLPCTATAATHHTSMLVLRPFTPPSPKRRIALVWRKSCTRPQVMAVLQEVIRKTALPCVEFLDIAPTILE